MSFENKFAAAEQELEVASIGKSKYYPPLLRLLKKMGINVRPYPYYSFWQIFVTTGLLFGTLSTLWNILDPWNDRTYSLTYILIRFLIMGSVFGLFVAISSRRKFKKLNLSDWSNLGS